MNYRIVLYVLGILLAGLGTLMYLTSGLSLYYREPDLLPFIYSATITLSVGLFLLALFRRVEKTMGIREGFAIVTLGWLAVVAFGALPYKLGGVFQLYTDAFFESMSGFTTTGATVLTDIEGQNHGILFWRSMSQWLGGMGIIMLSLAILPLLGVGGMQLYRAEIPGPTKDRLTPRIKVTARYLWMTYLVLTGLELVLLLMGGLSLFDAVTHTFTTMATGGFSVKSNSIAAYSSPYVQTVINVFMVIAGINFFLHFQALKGNLRCFLNDSETKFYLLIMLLFIVVVAADLRFNMLESSGRAIRLASFQVVSIVTTTGYVTDDFERWPQFARTALFVVMFIGGCSGSTGGSIKNSRWLLLLKLAYFEIYKLIHPKAVISIKMSGKPVGDEVLHGVMGFFMLYVSFFLLASLVLIAMGLDPETGLSAVASCQGNVGPGFGTVGAMDNYAHLPLAAKWVLSACMLVGRLEIYTVLVLFVPELWKRVR